jgi:hypothetical protein
MSFTAFNPFSLKKSPEYSAIVENSQEVVYYAESRFRSILQDLCNADNDRKKWTQKLLHRELVGTSLLVYNYI